MRTLLAAVKLQCAAALLMGCSPTLDFDGTTKGAGDGVDLPDAGGGEDFSCDAVEESATFCDDFEGQVISALWDVIEHPDVEGAKVDQTSANPRAGDRAMTASVPGDIADDAGYVQVVAERSFPELQGSPFSCTVSFAMAINVIDTAPGNPFIAAFQFLMGIANEKGYNQMTLRAVADENSYSLKFVENAEPGGDGIAGSPSPGAPIGQWLQVRFELDVVDPLGKAEGNHVKMWIDDRSIADFDLKWDLRGESPRMQLGIAYQDPAGDDGAWIVSYDNVLAVCEKK